MRLVMNAMVNGMHGKIGNNLVVRTLRGKFIASRRPKNHKRKAKNSERTDCGSEKPPAMPSE